MERFEGTRTLERGRLEPECARFSLCKKGRNLKYIVQEIAKQVTRHG
ncbi:MAG: hypothetical protein O2U62_04760 [Candidatus Bathyarchaeota archaeon]|jgi:hypothetical protein|nr:hypothetical protein [Candidatus Bathyarchaeota archaeon]